MSNVIRKTIAAIKDMVDWSEGPGLSVWLGFLTVVLLLAAVVTLLWVI